MRKLTSVYNLLNFWGNSFLKWKTHIDMQAYLTKCSKKITHILLKVLQCLRKGLSMGLCHTPGTATGVGASELPNFTLLNEVFQTLNLLEITSKFEISIKN